MNNETERAYSNALEILTDYMENLVVNTKDIARKGFECGNIDDAVISIYTLMCTRNTTDFLRHVKSMNKANLSAENKWKNLSTRVKERAKVLEKDYEEMVNTHFLPTFDDGLFFSEELARLAISKLAAFDAYTDLNDLVENLEADINLYEEW